MSPNPLGERKRKVPQAPKKPPQPSLWSKGVRFMAVGVEVAVAILLSLWVGQWLDIRLGSEPWLLLGCMLVGMIAALRILMRLR